MSCYGLDTVCIHKVFHDNTSPYYAIINPSPTGISSLECLLHMGHFCLVETLVPKENVTELSNYLWVTKGKFSLESATPDTTWDTNSIKGTTTQPQQQQQRLRNPTGDIGEKLDLGLGFPAWWLLKISIWLSVHMSKGNAHLLNEILSVNNNCSSAFITMSCSVVWFFGHAFSICFILQT